MEKNNSDKDVLYIIIPAYNEEENIKNVINDWCSVVEKTGEKSRLVIINDGSTDKTKDIICQMASQNEHIMPVTKNNAGHGAAVLYGYKFAIKEGADYIFQTDSDGQTIPEDFPDFWKQRSSYDMIIGHRNKRQDGISRIIVTKTLKLVLKLCFGVNITDANTPFRLMKADTLKKYVNLIPENYNLSNVMISVIYAKKKCSVKFIPITFKPRQGGKNSINIRKICKIGLQALKDFKRLNKMI